MTAKRIYVGNLSYNSTENDIRDAFARFGTIKEFKMVMDRETGRPRGFAFVEYNSADEANSAIETMDGEMMDGRNLTVKIANDKPARSNGGDRRARS